jgi:uncharacterized membrane protein YccC
MRVLDHLVRAYRTVGATFRSGFASAKGLQASALISGIAVGGGLAIAAAIGAVFTTHSVALVLGALCVSVSDRPAAPLEKMKRMALAFGLSSVTVAVAVAVVDEPIAEALVVLVVGFLAGLLTAWGRNAIPIGSATLLGLVFAHSLASPHEAALVTAAWFASGALVYGVYAAIVTPLLAGQTKRMLLTEALGALSAFLRAQRAILDPNSQLAADYGAVIDAQAALAERIQAARDVVFVDVSTDRDRLMAAALVVLIDLFEAAVSEQADLDALLELPDGEPLRSLRALLLLAASDVDRFSRALVDKRWIAANSIVDRRARLEKLTEMESDDDPRRRQPILATAIKVERLFARIDRLWIIVGDGEAARAALQGIDLGHFIERFKMDLPTLKQQLDIDSPVGRFAIRSSLALFFGCLLGEALPNRAHGVWIMLTVALVMRANYSTTRQRRYERLLGNLVGCGLSALILSFGPTQAAPVVVFVAAGLSHAFVLQSYLVSSIASCVTGLALIHTSEPNGDLFFLTMRLLDTALGAAVAFSFSFVLPSWERKTIAAQAANLAKAGLDYARFTLSADAVNDAYRLARRRMYDSTATLSAASRRMLEEPGSPRRQPRAMSGLLAASYAFAAEMASVRLYLHARSEAERADAAPALARARRLIEMVFARSGAVRATPDEDERDFADAGALARRLGRAVRASRKLAASAARVRAYASLGLDKKADGD